MVVIYCYLERENCKILKFHENNSSAFENNPSYSFKRRPPISVALKNFKIK